MSWKALVLGMIEDLNPRLFKELCVAGDLDEYATECARTMAEQYASQANGADAATRATVREVLIAQTREEIQAATAEFDEDESEEEIDLSGAKEVLETGFGIHLGDDEYDDLCRDAVRIEQRRRHRGNQ